MSILSDFEDRIGGAVEGLFAGVFRSPVQPAELAKAAGREMDRRRKLGVGKVYAPTLFSVLLSPEDGDQLGGFADTLAGELETYLAGYAREKRYDLATRPRVRFLIDDDLRLGRFQVIGELMSAAEIEAELGPQHDIGVGAGASAPASAAVQSASVLDGSAAGLTAVQPSVRPSVQPSTFDARLTYRGSGRSIPLSPDEDRIIVGRLSACDVCLDDHNASRQHAALEYEYGEWFIVDLGSTNGTLVNGIEVDRARLHEGDVVTIGVTELVFHEAQVGHR